jgi:hypothetical protein
MAQLSRPYQMALVAALAALALFAVAWFAVLHRPGAGGSSSPGAPASSAVAGSSAPSSSSSSASSAAGPGSPTSVYHGAAPGVEGLTRAIAKAHGAVATSEHNAAQLQRDSEAASAPGSQAAGAGTAPHSGTAANGASASGATPASNGASGSAARPGHAAAQRSAPTGQRSASPGAAHARATLQATLAAELKQGKVLLLLFWNPRSSDDVAVRRQLRAAAAKLRGKVAEHVALAKQVGEYGAVTRDVQILGTPTLVVVGAHHQAITVTGLIDAYAIEQAFGEARHAP